MKTLLRLSLLVLSVRVITSVKYQPRYGEGGYRSLTSEVNNGDDQWINNNDHRWADDDHQDDDADEQDDDYDDDYDDDIDDEDMIRSKATLTKKVSPIEKKSVSKSKIQSIENKPKKYNSVVVQTLNRDKITNENRKFVHSNKNETPGVKKLEKKVKQGDIKGEGKKDTRSKHVVAADESNKKEDEDIMGDEEDEMNGDEEDETEEDENKEKGKDGKVEMDEDGKEEKEGGEKEEKNEEKDEGEKEEKEDDEAENGENGSEDKIQNVNENMAQKVKPNNRNEKKPAQKPVIKKNKENQVTINFDDIPRQDTYKEPKEPEVIIKAKKDTGDKMSTEKKRKQDMRNQVEQLTGGIEDLGAINGDESFETALKNLKAAHTKKKALKIAVKQDTDIDEATKHTKTNNETSKVAAGTKEDDMDEGEQTHGKQIEWGTSSKSVDNASPRYKDGYKEPENQLDEQANTENVQELLKELVPTGILPNIPKGFDKLSEISTVSFTYDVDENNDVTVTSDLKKPLLLFDEQLALTNNKLTFYYKNKEKKGGRWTFETKGIWRNKRNTIEVTLESAEQDNHFILTGEGKSLALKDFTSMFISNEALPKSGMNLVSFENTILSEPEIYIVFKDEGNLVSAVTGKTKMSTAKQCVCKTFIQKFPDKEPSLSVMFDFEKGTPVSDLNTVMDSQLTKMPYISELLSNKGLLRIAKDEAFGFVASTGIIKKLQLQLFGDGPVEQQLGSHIPEGATITLPFMIKSDVATSVRNMAVKISPTQVQFLPSKDETLNVETLLKTLSEFTKPKLISLGYPDLTDLRLNQLNFDLNKSTYTLSCKSTKEFTVVPGLLALNEASIELKQFIPNQFASLAFFAKGKSTLGSAKLDVSVWTNSATGEVLVEGTGDSMWIADISQAFAVDLETNEETTKILEENQMLNMEIQNGKMLTIFKNERTDLVHFYGPSKPPSWNNAIELEVVVFSDSRYKRKHMTVGYVFNKLPLNYAIDALCFSKFPTPRLLDNSRNTTLVLSPSDVTSMFLHPAMNGLSFQKGLSLIGEFRLPDVCSMNTQCETATQLLGTEKWYQVQGLVSLRGFVLNGYIDKEFILGKDLILRDNILEFAINVNSQMSISTALNIYPNNLTFHGYINFENDGARLRMSSNDEWRHPFPGDFVSFGGLQLDLQYTSGLPVQDFFVTGELNFGVPGSLYRMFAPAYLTFNTSNLDTVGFQATLTNATIATMMRALNYRTSLPDILRNSRFPEMLVMTYSPEKNIDELELFGKLQLLVRTVFCKLHIKEGKKITAMTSHSKYPLMLDNGLVMVYAEKNNTKLGPRALFDITPDKATFKMEGYATFMGIGTETEIDVGESGTQFALNGNLFGLTETVVSIMSPDDLAGESVYLASACIPKIIPDVVQRVNYMVSKSAAQAQRYTSEATQNYQQATLFHDEALAKEKKYRHLSTVKDVDIENENRALFLAEERFNKTCDQQHCDKTCIGCTAWRKCCDHDVFGNCVNCPGWRACCWKGTSPICKAKNHGCKIMKDLARENLENIKKRVLTEKQVKYSNEKSLWESEYLTGKTEAVLDAAQRALRLIGQDSQLGLDAAAAVKKHGLERLMNIENVCFHTTLKSLATSCVDLKIKATFADKPGVTSVPYYGCLNRDIVPKMASYLINYMFPTKRNTTQATNGKKKTHHGPQKRNRVSVLLNQLLTKHREQKRLRRHIQDNEEDEGTPFWLIRDNHQSPMFSLLQQRNNVPKSPLRKKWQIPASRVGKCKVYRQLMEICKDMMSTIQLMYRSFTEGKNQFLKRKTELELGLNTTIADLEKQAYEMPELKSRLSDIEINIRTVDAGVNQWKLNCETDQAKQNKEAVEEWVKTMEGRITTLGGQGVERFLSNLFRAFEGMFLGSDTPHGNADEVLNTLQIIREISSTFHDIFSKEITLENANTQAEKVQEQLKRIRKKRMFCD